MMKTAYPKAKAVSASRASQHPFAAAAILATVATEALTTPEPQLRHFTKHICDQYLGFTAYNWFYRELDFCGF